MNNNPNQDPAAELLEHWPPRCAGSDSNLLGAAAEKAARDALLEDWPESKSCLTLASLDSGEDDDASAAHIRTVHFSDTSQLYIHEREPFSLLRSLSYTDDERHRFGNDARLEGRRIRILLNEAPLNSLVESFGYLLHHDIIGRDEIVGIEHFCFDTPMRVSRRRRRHEAAVLREQEQQEQERGEVEEAALNLSKFAQSSSLGSLQNARMRAEMAASTNL